jgi:hypothetical protein
MFVSSSFGMPNAVWRQCDVRATAKASDGMLLSGVPIPGCRSPLRLPLGPTFAFQEIGLGLLPTPPAGGPLAADISNYTRRISVGDGRVAAGVPVSDSESRS